MAELGFTYDQLLNEVGHYLGYKREADPTTPVVWTANQQTELALYVQGGLRLFYYPPPVGENQPPYEWSFLRLSATHDATVANSGLVDMPTDFSGEGGPFVITQEAEYTLRLVSYAHYLSLKTNNAQTGAPHYIALHPKTVLHDSTKQLWQACYYPTPDKTYTVTFEYRIDPDQLATTEYPIGGTAHAETVKAACLAYAELDKKQEKGLMWQTFMERLAASIQLDQKSLGKQDEPTFPVAETAPTNLNVTYQVLARWAARILGWDEDDNTWSFTQTKQLDEIIQEGLRRFYYPQPVKEGEAGHQWSFLLVDATFNTVDGTAQYTLPNDTDGTILQVCYGPVEVSPNLTPISYEQYAALMSQGDTAAGVSRFYCVYPKVEAHTTAVQTFYMNLYPTPNAEMAVVYRYRTCPAPLTTTNCYPLGTGAHASTILASVCAVAEEMKGVSEGPWNARFLIQLAGSIESDKLAAPHQAGPTWPLSEVDPSDMGINYTILCRGIGRVLGYGWDSATWTKVQDLHIQEVLQKGLRKFYYPPVLPNERVAHQWSFLKPVTSLTAWCDVAVDSDVTGSGSHSGGYTTFTASEATFYASMVNATVTITDVGSFPIYSYTSTTVVTLTGNATATDKTFSIACESVFALPSGCAGIIGDLTFDANECTATIPIISEAQIRKMQQRTTYTGRPKYGAIRPRTTTGAAAQQFELILYPEPDDDYTLYYRYYVRMARLTSTAPYPYGGPEHAETILEACLAAAEEENGERGVHYANFLEGLTASISLDQKATTPHWLGLNADNSDNRDAGIYPRHSNVTYNDVEYP